MLKVENLSKVFNIHILNDKLIEGFNGVSFSVKKGTSLGISGPSGAGKSSILKCIYRKYLSTSGKILYESGLFGNVDLATADEHVILKIREKEFGYITQFLRVIPRVPCIDIVVEPLLSKGIEREQARDMTVELLRKMRIPEKLFEAYPSTFSGGEQQRINIAKEVISAPGILLLDEPTASLDKKSVETVLEILEDLKKSGTTMIGVFHDKKVLKEFSDEIYRLENNDE